MNTNSSITRSKAAKMEKQKTISTSQATLSASQNYKRSRDDLDQTEDRMQSFDDLLARMKEMIDDGNARIESKIKIANLALVNEINTLRTDVQQLRNDGAGDISRLTECFAKTKEEVKTNKDAIARLEKSNDLLLTGVPYNPSEKTGDYFLKIATALGYSDTDVPVVFSKRLARIPIAVGSSPPILIQFAFKAARDDFFHRYLSTRNICLRQLGFNVDKRIFINENLNEATRQLKGSALELKKEGRIKTVFTKNGIIYVETDAYSTAVPICDQDQLNVLVCN